MQLVLNRFLGKDFDIIPKEFWQEISVFSNIVIPVSGGVDSTILVNEFLKKGIPFQLIWNDTRRSLKSARKTLTKIFAQSGMPWTITYPQVSQKRITEETREAMRKIVQGDMKYMKSSIPCCKYLKEDGWNAYIKKFISQDTLIISGIAGYEGNQRQWRCYELRKKNTFLRFKVKEKRWFAYPLRDITTQKQGKALRGYLQDTLFHGTQRSGCNTCPIVALFESAIEEDEKRIEQSKKVWLPKMTV